MKTFIAAAIAFYGIARLTLSAACVDSYIFTFDEHGNGYTYFYYTAGVNCTNSVTPISYQVGPDPSGGITNRPVLIYSTKAPAFGGGGDVALVATNGYGTNVIYHLIRFLEDGRVIFYAADNSGSLADVGIPASGSHVEITENPAGGTWFNPATPFPTSYEFFTEPVNPAFVLSTNRLSIARDGNGVILSWSTNATNFALYEGTNAFRMTNWTAITNLPLVSGGQHRLALPGPLSATKFYRLVSQ